MWQNWINGLLGLWLIVSPFILETAQAVTTNYIVVGALVLISALWSVGKEQNMTREHHERHA